MAEGALQSPGGFQTKPGIQSKLGGGQKNHSSWFQLEGLTGPKTSKQSHTTILAVSTGQLEIYYNNPITMAHRVYFQSFSKSVRSWAFPSFPLDQIRFLLSLYWYVFISPCVLLSKSLEFLLWLVTRATRWPLNVIFVLKEFSHSLIK